MLLGGQVQGKKTAWDCKCSFLILPNSSPNLEETEFSELREELLEMRAIAGAGGCWLPVTDNL